MSRLATLSVGGYTLRIETRAVLVGAGLVVAIGICAVIGLLIGDYPLSPGEAVQALFGTHHDPLARFFVQRQRAPRVLAAIAIGAALGASGAVFQTVSRNPLGSPDVIGFTTGAATGALVAIIVVGAGPAETAIGALVGGFVTALVVYLLAWRRGLAGSRLVLVGIGTAAVLQAVNSLLVVRASLVAAQTAGQWLAGSLNAMDPLRATWISAAAGAGVVALVLLSRSMAVMMLGDDVATGLGVRVERRRLQMVLAGVALVALATAAAGPIGFVALAAPQLARRLTDCSGVGILSAAAMGGLLVLASDLIAQRLLAPTQLAVGVVTGALGGAYLIWLLARERNRA